MLSGEDYYQITTKEVYKLREYILKIGPIIRKIKEENSGKIISGKDVCPICGNEIYWSLAQNGRIWIRCQTDDCVGIME